MGEQISGLKSLKEEGRKFNALKKSFDICFRKKDVKTCQKILSDAEKSLKNIEKLSRTLQQNETTTNKALRTIGVGLSAAFGVKNAVDGYTYRSIKHSTDGKDMYATVTPDNKYIMGTDRKAFVAAAKKHGATGDTDVYHMSGDPKDPTRKDFNKKLIGKAMRSEALAGANLVVARKLQTMFTSVLKKCNTDIVRMRSRLEKLKASMMNESTDVYGKYCEDLITESYINGDISEDEMYILLERVYNGSEADDDNFEDEYM